MNIYQFQDQLWRIIFFFGDVIYCDLLGWYILVYGLLATNVKYD